MDRSWPATMRALQIDAYGGPEVVRMRQIAVPRPGPDEVLVRLAYSGVNFMDVYTRLGRYAQAGAKSGHYQSGLPLTLGIEGAGRVVAVGANVRAYRPGDRVAYALARGSYAEYAAVPERQLAPVPAGLALDRAAAAVFHGITAHYLANDIGLLAPGRSCLVHAGAGGIGQILIQLARRAGATVAATASSEAKRAVAAARGADHVTDYAAESYVAACREAGGGSGVDVVFDSVGRDVYEGNLQALRRKGLFVHYGANSGSIGPIDAMRLADSGSLYFTRPRLADYVPDGATMRMRAGAVFAAMVDGSVTVEIENAVALADVGEAHRALESRAAIGKTVAVIDASLDD